MRKQELMELKAGQVVLDTRNNVELEIVGVGETKVILINGKEYSKSTLKRYFKLVEEEEVQEDNTVEEQDNTEEQDTTADTDTTTQDTDTTATTATNTQDDQLHDQHDTTTKTHTTEGNTTTPGQQIFENSISGVVIQHGCHLNRMKEYVKVGKEGYKGCLVYIRTARDKSWKFDVSKKTWNKLTSEYQQYLIEQYGASIVDSSRGLWRIANCKELDVFEVLLLTALKIA